jgi:hypothetical protein
MSPHQTTVTPLDKVVECYCDWYDKNIRAAKHFKQDIFKQIHDSGLKAVIERDDHGDVLKAGYRVIDDGEKHDGETPFVISRKETKSKAYNFEWPKESPDEYLERVEREWEEMLSRDTADKIDLSGTYDYDSDDPDKDDGDISIHDDDKKLELPLAEPEPENIGMIDCEEYENNIDDALASYIV